MKIRKLLPPNLDFDLYDEYALVGKEEYREQRLIQYEKYCKSVKSKDIIGSSKELATIIVHYCISNPTCNEDLLQLIVKNISKVMPKHNDSVDCKEMLVYLKN